MHYENSEKGKTYIIKIIIKQNKNQRSLWNVAGYGKLGNNGLFPISVARFFIFHWFFRKQT